MELCDYILKKDFISGYIWYTDAFYTRITYMSGLTTSLFVNLLDKNVILYTTIFCIKEKI